MASTASFQDNFLTQAFDPAKWTNQSFSGGSANQSGGTLVCTPLPNNGNTGGQLNSVNTYDLTGSYCQVKVNQIVQQGGATFFYLQIDTNNKIFFQCDFSGVGTPVTLKANQLVGGVQTVLATINYDANTMVYWRFRELLGNTYFEYSSDGIAWTILANIPNPIVVTALTIILEGFDNNIDTNPGSAIFSNLNIIPYLWGKYSFGLKPDSFLHSVGRSVHPPPPATIVSETEQETSQIIVDKIVQGEIGGGSTLTMDVPIPSWDAVLIVTGGSVVATGGAWQSVKYNGISLTKLAQTGVAGNSAEIWWMPYPPVGIYSLVIVPTAVFGQVYANAMVLLGIDKKSTNITTASVTDAASTSIITANITPDAPNSVIIDCISSLDAVSVPVPDASQTQVFNPTSLNINEYVLSTFKLSSNVVNNMNYDLSTSVNASLVAAAFRPAYHPSLWFPNIDTREIDDVVTANGLDAGTTLSGTKGYKPSNFYLNSFFHTVGRNLIPTMAVGKTITYGYKPSTFYLNSYLHTIGRHMKPSNLKSSNSSLLLLGVG